MADKRTLYETSLTKLNGRNYSTWKFTIQTLLVARELWEICKVRDISESRRVKNAEAKAIIFNSMDDNQKARIGNCETAHDLWIKIQETYEGSDSTRKAKSLHKFMTMKCKDEEAVGDFCSRFESALTDLEATGYRVDEGMKVFAFKSALPSDLYEKADTWEMCQKTPLLSELITLMRYREKKIEDEPTIALYMEESHKKPVTSRTSNPTSKSPSKQSTCNYCKKPGHFWRDCRKKKEDDKRKKGFAEKRKKREDKKEPDYAYVCVEKGTQTFTQGRAMEPTYFQNSVDEVFGYQAKGMAWIVDSGATRSMTSKLDWLTEYTPFATPHEILVGDGKSIWAYGLGNIHVINRGFKTWLKDVLYSPALPMNLLSVKQLAKQGFDVTFREESVKIKKDELEINGSQDDRNLYSVLLETDLGHDPHDQLFVAVTMDDWHRRFGHTNNAAIKLLHKSKAVTGFEVKGSEVSECLSCTISKLKRVPHPPRGPIPSLRSTQIIHFDTCGPIKPVSLGFNKYFVLATDQNSGFKFVKFAKDKAAIPDIVKSILLEAYLYSGRDTSMVITDNGTEFMNSSLKNFLKNKNIIHETSTAYTPQQNGLAERSNRTLIEAVRCLLADSKLPHRLWTEAAATAIYVMNRTLRRGTLKTKFELFTGKQPDVSHLRIFGQYAAVLTPKQFRDSKWSPAGQIFRFVGYTSRSNTFRLFDEANNKIVISCDVKFLIGMHATTNRPVEKETFTLMWAPKRHVTFASASEKGQEIVEVNSPTNTSDEETDDVQIVKDGQETMETEPPSVNDQIHQEIIGELNNDRVMTRSRARALANAQPIFPSPCSSKSSIEEPETQNDQPEDADDSDEDFEEAQDASGSTTIDEDMSIDQALFAIEDEPLTVSEALEGSEGEQWKLAMDREMDSLNKNGTWTLIDRPQGAKTVKCKWVFKRKLAPDGSIGDYKARLVAKGYSQVPGIDFKETFAPVAQMNTVRALMAMANQFDLEMAQFDVKTAFLYGDLDETILMDFPEGYENKNGKVCKLEKSLYGLKQSPRQWNLKFKEFLTKFKLKPSINDSCLYYDEERTIFLAIYVDDGIIVSKNKDQVTGLLKFLESKLEIKSLPCVSYLGFQIFRDRKKKELILHQRQYVERILERFKMHECKPTSTPEEVGQVDCENSPSLGEEVPFKQAIGSLLYLVTCTRPDLSHAVSIASRTSKPTVAHWALIKRILRYLSGTKNLGLRFRWERNPVLRGYCDADYANDVKTRRSTSGYGILYGKALIAWRCQRQPIVALSTTEAEYISGCELVKDLLPIREILIELKMMEETPTTVFIDNLSAVHIAKNSGGQQRTKHIDVRQKWLTEQHESKKISVEFIPGEKQLADMLTKPLHKTKFQTNRNLLMSALAIMFFLLTCVGNSSLGLFFQPVSPVVYETTRIPYFIGNRELNVTFKELNPCNRWFKNITVKNEWNDRLVEMCNSTFVDRTIKLLKNCRKPYPGEVTAHKLYTTGWVRRERTKRAIPLLAFFAGISSLGSVFSVTRSEANANNIELLRNEALELRRANEQAARVLDKIKATTQSLIDTDKQILAKIQFIITDAEMMKKVAYLVNRYETYFDDVGMLMRDINSELPNQRFSPSLASYTQANLWEEPAARWSSVTRCTVALDQESNMELHIEGIVPRRDPSIKILQSRSMKVWNRTSSGDYCWMRYAGPRFVIANVSNSCYDDLDTNSVIDESVTGLLCDRRDQRLRSIDQLFVSQGCFKKPEFTEASQQVIRYNGDHHIYCPNSTILVHNSNYSCPDYVFPLSLAESFKISTYRYEASKTNEIIINSLDRQLNEDIKLQLNTDVKISLANATLFELELAKYSKLMQKITGREIKLEKPSWLLDSFMDPILFIPRLIGEIWGWLKHALIAAIALGLIWMLLLFAPLLRTLIGAISWPIGKIGEMCPTWKRKISKRSRRKNNWDDSYVRRLPDIEEGLSD